MAELPVGPLRLSVDFLGDASPLDETRRGVAAGRFSLALPLGELVLRAAASAEPQADPELELRAGAVWRDWLSLDWTLPEAEALGRSPDPGQPPPAPVVVLSVAAIF